MLTVLRTANAGVLLELDGAKILLDGVSPAVYPYPATSAALRSQLLSTPVDALVYTHTHEDHYDPQFYNTFYENFAGPVMGPAEIPFSTLQAQQVGQVVISAKKTRHIGKNCDISHNSYLIQGSKCIWFMGDATPLQADVFANWPKPDILMVPYGFVIGKGWQICKALQPDAVVILHLPDPQQDIYHLRESVEQTVGADSYPRVWIPSIGEKQIFA